MPSPFRFRKIAPETARLRTAVHRHLRGVVFDAGGGREWRVDAVADSGGAGAMRGAVVQGTLGGGEFTLWLNDPDWRVAAASALDVPADAVAALPDALRRAGLECFADDVFAAVQKATGLPVAIQSFAVDIDAEKPLAAACPFRCVGPDGLAVAGAWVIADGDGTAREQLLRVLTALPVRSGELPDSLPLTAVVAMGRWTASAEEVNTLAVGDVALSAAGAERSMTVGGRFRFAARAENGILHVEGKTMTTERPIPEAGAETALVNPDEAEVELHARVGSLTVTLGELRALCAGQIVEFDAPVDSPAVLTVNGMPVARGELVDVGGRMGMCITRMTE